jgi:hypothetical protein
MYLVAIAWIYITLMMAVAEAFHPQGSLLGAFFTFVLYGVAPLALVLYLLNTPGRRRRLKQEMEAAANQPHPDRAELGSHIPPNAGGGRSDGGSGTTRECLMSYKERGAGEIFFAALRANGLACTAVDLNGEHTVFRIARRE